MAELTITHRNLPHWSLEGAWYYVTFCVGSGVLKDHEKSLVLDHIKSGHGKLYRLVAACVMPDHVHVILCPNDGHSLSRVMRMIKGATARLINLRRGTRGPIWQAESWDRIIRDDRECQQKLRYVLLNPVEEGLVDDPWAYPWWYLNPT